MRKGRLHERIKNLPNPSSNCNRKGSVRANENASLNQWKFRKRKFTVEKPRLCHGFVKVTKRDKMYLTNIAAAILASSVNAYMSSEQQPGMMGQQQSGMMGQQQPGLMGRQPSSMRYQVMEMSDPQMQAFLQQEQQQKQLQQSQQAQQQQPSTTAEGVMMTQQPVAQMNTYGSSLPSSTTDKSTSALGGKSRTFTNLTLPPNFSVSEDQTCQDAWSLVDAQVEDVLEESPDTPYYKALQAFQKILEDIGMPNLIDAVTSTMGTKGVRTLVREMDKLKKRFLQLANRKAVLDKHPEYLDLVTSFKQAMTSDARANSRTPVSQVCVVPAALTNFILRAIKVEEETEHELVNFQEPVVHIVDTIIKAMKKSAKRRGKREPKGIVLDKHEMKQLEAFSKALKSRKGGRRGGRGGDDEGFGGSIILIVIVVLVIIIAIILAVVLLMRRRN